MNNILAMTIGALISVMVLSNGALAASTGNYLSSVIIHLVGFVTVIIVLIATKSRLHANRGIPVYMYSAGAIGVLTVLFNNLTFEALGVALTLALGLLGQSLASILIDHYGLLGMQIAKFNIKKIYGLISIVLGVIIMTIF